MKKTIAFLAFALSLSAFAQESVILSSKNESVNAAEAIAVRTNKTPNTVEISFRIPMDNSVCERYETTLTLRTSSLHCGNDYRIRRVTERVCTRTNPHNKQCLNYENRTREIRTAHARTCMVPTTFCAQYGTATSYKRDTMKIKFKNLPALGDSESETFLISAEQKSYNGSNVVYEVKPLETLREYKVSQKKVLGLFKVDSYVVEEK
jgi:hypothetical protein